MRSKIRPFVISVLIALGVGALSALLTQNDMTIYAQLRTPPLAPPAILFPIAWSILYVLMGIGAALIYTNGKATPKEKEAALSTYAASLFVNFTWSIIFFHLRAFLAAFVWLLLLLVLIVKTILSYRKISPVAAFLQIPYALWVSFAGYLTLGIWLLNR